MAQYIGSTSPDDSRSADCTLLDSVLANPRVRLVREALANRGFNGEIRVFDESTRTAAQAAIACECPVGAIANSLVFRCEETPLLILTSGAHRVDVRYVQRQLGCGKLHRADAAFVLGHTGQVIGGVAPLGHPKVIQTILDVALSQFQDIWAAAGHPNTVFRTSYGDLLEYTQASEMKVSED
ncbi:YbaK/EbsC family protein [Bifidobacterium sp.]|uniref:YbaK/EbsC family protein n=1 Tax=Bifidobacterium sp. TaxID=41200 RepID=UPI0025C26843|nr:YbaK/EbsC family protein [Bifidobacterium sp.]MCI1635911.1 YbaK/EbsC family protein [Bifidobacterium sp.]